jgi:hypothetical protein
MANKIITLNPPKIVIVRCQLAGIHVGELVSSDAKTVTLKDAHRIWRWRGANTVTELAIRGASMTDYTRISERTPGQQTLAEWFEIIECSADAAENLRKPRWCS